MRPRELMDDFRDVRMGFVECLQLADEGRNLAAVAGAGDGIQRGAPRGVEGIIHGELEWCEGACFLVENVQRLLAESARNQRMNATV